MALDPAYKTKAVSAVSTDLKVDAVVDVRVATPSYPSNLTYCTVGRTRYEVDHVDGDGKTRTPDEVAAILKQLMYDGGHAVDPNPKLSSTESAPESQPMKTDI